MFTSFSSGWQLVKASWAILRADKELIWFPIIAGVVMIIVSIVMLIPSILFTLTLSATGADEGTFNVVGVIGLFIYYLVSYTISIYFNVGLVGAAMIRLDGGDPTVKDGFRIANERIGTIIGYAAISATIGVILRIVRERGIIGEIVSSFMSLAWNVATFLAVPILVAKNISPWGAVQESISLLKRTWGEQISGNFSMGGIFGIVYLLVIVVCLVLGGIFAFMADSFAMAVVMGIIMVVAIVLLSIMQGALNGIFQAALYRYAETGTAPDDFDISLIQGAFKTKEKRGIL
jgi:hypothetical protein